MKNLHTTTLSIRSLRTPVILIVFFAFFASTVFGQTGEIRGFIYNKNGGEPILYATIKVKNTKLGTISDENGYYDIIKLAPGKYTIQFSYLGFDTTFLEINLHAGEKLTKNIFLVGHQTELKEVSVNASRSKQNTRVEISKVSITAKDIQMLPSIGGQADLAQYLQVLPGVVFTGDQGGQLYIRGGSPVQNKLTLDGMTIYNPFHSIGLYSVLDVDIIRNADIYTAAFPAEYGGRISSVMDIKTRDGNKEHFAGIVSVSPFLSKLSLEGPLLKMNENGTSISYLFSGRTSYLKSTAPVFYPYTDASGLPYTFTDLYGKVNITGAGGSNISFFGFNFKDNVDFKNSTSYGWNSYGAGTRFLIVPSTTSTIMEGTVAVSGYSSSQTNPGEKPSTSSINGFEGNINFLNYYGNDLLKYGINLIAFNTNFSFDNAAAVNVSQQDFTTELASFVNYTKVLGRWVIDPGLRLHYYASQSELAFEPRLGVKYVLSERVRVKFAGGYYSQNLMGVTSDRDVVNLFYGFIAGPADLPSHFDGQATNSVLQKAIHGVGGFEFDLGKNVSLNLEGYIKDFTQLTNLNPNKIFDNTASFLNKPDYLREDYIIETGKAYGMDLKIVYDKRPFYVWVTYSLGFVTRNDSFQTYYTNWDRRHTINVVTSYDFGKKHSWQFNSRFTLGTGFPFTKTAGFYDQQTFQNGITGNYASSNGILGVLYNNQINTGRLSTYHRLDVSLQKKYTFGQYRELRLNLTVTNVYDRANVFYFNRVTYERINQLPILPSFGITLLF